MGVNQSPGDLRNVLYVRVPANELDEHLDDTGMLPRRAFRVIVREIAIELLVEFH